MRLRIFAVLIGFSSYFLRGAKYVTAIFFTLHRPAKIYAKSNLQKSGSYCGLSEHAYSIQKGYEFAIIPTNGSMH